MDPDYFTIASHLLCALVAGGIIGLERSYHGRPAGFRTHTLVCVASSLLMLVMLFQWKWMPGAPLETIRTDPTRMAQGIMTGIGFLGAGVIFKEGHTVRGLTTAASIWMTSAIGILFGIGFYMPAIVATLVTVGILSAFRWIEAMMPSQSYVYYTVRFARENVMVEDDVKQMLRDHGFRFSHMNYRITDEGDCFEYRMVLETRNETNISRLARFMNSHSQVRSFRITPTGD